MLDPEKKSDLANEIDRLMHIMGEKDPYSREYAATVDQLSKLWKIQIDSTPPPVEKKPYRPNPDTLVLAAANLVAIGMIIRHEHLNVITSKALSFVRIK